MTLPQITNMTELRKCLNNCSLCERRQFPQEIYEPIIGMGKSEPLAMFVLSPPTLIAQQNNSFFELLDMKTLKQLISDCELTDNVYITNIAKCGSPKKDTKGIKVCKETYLSKEIEIVKPKLIFGFLGKTIKHDFIPMPTFHQLTNSTSLYQATVKEIINETKNICNRPKS